MSEHHKDDSIDSPLSRVTDTLGEKSVHHHYNVMHITSFTLVNLRECTISVSEEDTGTP